ncbi:hypothetical protein EV424DRAFT_1543013 [Suillus variegatus]|nr:hypothetical protein EV424DRAFT_1543013 [Suillus variegatus]
MIALRRLRYSVTELDRKLFNRLLVANSIDYHGNFTCSSSSLGLVHDLNPRNVTSSSWGDLNDQRLWDAAAASFDEQLVGFGHGDPPPTHLSYSPYNDQRGDHWIQRSDQLQWPQAQSQPLTLPLPSPASQFTARSYSITPQQQVIWQNDSLALLHHHPSQLGPLQDGHHGIDAATVYNHQPSQYSASQSQPQFGQLGPLQDSHHGPDAAAVYHHQPSQYSALQSQPQFGQLGPLQDSHHGPDAAAVYHHQPSQYSALQSQPQFGQLGPSQDSHHGPDAAAVYNHQPSQYSASQSQPQFGQLGPSQDSHHGPDAAAVYHHQQSQYPASQRQPHLGLAHPRPSVAHNHGFVATWAFPPSPTLTQKAHAAVIPAASLNLAPQLTEVIQQTGPSRESQQPTLLPSSLSDNFPMLARATPSHAPIFVILLNVHPRAVAAAMRPSSMQATIRSSMQGIIPFGLKRFMFRCIERMKRRAFKDSLLPSVHSLTDMANSVWTAEANSPETDGLLRTWSLEQLEDDPGHATSKLGPVLMEISGRMTVVVRVFVFLKYDLDFSHDLMVMDAHITERANRVEGLVANNAFIYGTISVEGIDMDVAFANPTIITLARYLLYDSEFRYHRYITGNDYFPLLAMIATQCLWVFQEYITGRYVNSAFIQDANRHHYESYVLQLAALTPARFAALVQLFTNSSALIH